MTEKIVSAEAGIVECDHRRVAIVGAGPSRWQAPWDDDSWCWWALNEIAQPRFDRHFELHPMRVQSPRECDWLAACPAPCYVLDLETSTNVQNAVRYPLDRVLAVTDGRRYFTCTFAYQVALALSDPAVEEIGLFGVDLDLGTAREQTVELACVRYWVGVADGRGVRVAFPPGSPLDRTDLPLYGYDYDEEVDAAARTIQSVALALPVESWGVVLRKLGAFHRGEIDRAAAALSAAMLEKRTRAPHA